MSTPTVPADRDGNDAAGVGPKRRIATVTGAAAVLAAALGATACAATPTGSSTQASLTGSARQVAAASPPGGHAVGGRTDDDGDGIDASCPPRAPREAVALRQVARVLRSGDEQGRVTGPFRSLHAVRSFGAAYRVRSVGAGC